MKKRIVSKKLLGFFLSTALIMDSSGICALAAEYPPASDLQASTYAAVSGGDVSSVDSGIVTGVDTTGVETSGGDVSGGDIVTSGTWYGMNWSINSKEILTISGSYDGALEGEDSEPGWIYEYFTSAKITASGVTSTAFWFQNCISLTALDLSGFDTSNVTSMESMFAGCGGLTALDLSSFNTSNVTSMANMFQDCYSLTALNVSGFDTSNVTSMESMFAGCSELTALDVKNFNTSQVTSMANMFLDCYSLTALDVKNFNTSQATSMESMFAGCSELTALDVSGFDTSKATSMASMFAGCSELTALDVKNFNTSQVTSVASMFAGCKGLTSLDLSALDMSSVTDAIHMLTGCTALTQLQTPLHLSADAELPITMQDGNVNLYDALPLNREDSLLLTPAAGEDGVIASGNQSGMRWRIGQDGVLTISGSQTVSSATSYLGWHNYSSNITSAVVTAADVTDTSYWFSGCQNLESVDFSNFDTSKVTNMRRMFTGCTGLTTLDLTGLDTACVTNMSYMFMNCSGLQSLNISGFDLNAVTDMTGMFSRCSSLSELTFPAAETGTSYGSKVTRIDNLFYGCGKLASLDMSGFDLSGLSNNKRLYLFRNCVSLKEFRTPGGLSSGCILILPFAMQNASSTLFEQIGATDLSEGSILLTALPYAIAAIPDQTYTGKAITPEVTVKYDSKDLVLNQDYTVRYSNNVNAADKDAANAPTVTVTGIGSYTGTATAFFTILAKEMNSGNTTVAAMEYTADGTAKKEIPQVTVDGVKLVADRDFTVEYPDTTEGAYTIPGTYSVIITGKGNYSGTVNASIVITAATFQIAAIPDQTYTGQAITPEVTVTGAGQDQTLISGTDYEVVYSNNVNAADKDASNAPTVTVTGKGDYSGTVSAHFTILAKVMNSDNTTVAAMEYTADGTEKKYTPEVTVDGVKLAAGTDFTVEYPDTAEGAYTAPGNYSVVITGKGNYSGTVNASIVITKAASYAIAAIPDQTYTGQPITPEVTVSYGDRALTPGTDYDVTYSNNVNAADKDAENAPTVTVTGKGSYTGTAAAHFTILAKAMNSGNTTVAPMLYTADGTEKKYTPEVTVDGVRLAANKDFTADFPDEGEGAYKAPGTYNVVITGMGNYSGTVTVSMEIREAAAYAIDDIPDQIYTGKAIKPEVTVTYGGVTLVPGRDYTVSYKNNVNAADKDADKAPTVTIKGKGNYTGSISANFTILPKEISEEDVSSPVYVTDDKLKKTAPTVTVDGRKLKVNKDFTADFPDEGEDAYKAPGEYSVVITGKGNYSGEITKSVVILERNQVPASKLKVASIPACNYAAGEAAEPAPKVTCAGKTATKDVDYEISYRDNDRPGKATLIITGLENSDENGVYIYGSVEKTFTIKGTPLSRAKVSYTTTADFTGSEIEPEVTLTIGTTPLDPETDYAVSYLNNVNAGKGTIVLTGCGGYTGTVKKTFTIRPAADVADRLKIEFTDGPEAAYSQSGAKPEVTVTLDEMPLVSGKDYTVSYQNNKKLAEADAVKAPAVTVKGKGNYKFQKSKNFAITAKSLADEDIKAVSADKFTGGRGSLLSPPVVTDGNGKKLKANRDYTIIAYYVDGKKFDGSAVPSDTTITVELEGKGSYEGTAYAAYRIADKDISKAVQVTAKKVTYHEGEVVFTPEMLAGDYLTITDKTTGENLAYNDDYIITGYKNNNKKGTATVTIQGIGTYGGTRTIKFSIVANTMKK